MDRYGLLLRPSAGGRVEYKSEGCLIITNISFLINHRSHQIIVLPLPTETNDESDTAEDRQSTAQRCNGGQCQKVADWPRLQLLSGHRALSRATHTNNVSFFVTCLWISLLVSICVNSCINRFLLIDFMVFNINNVEQKKRKEQWICCMSHH